MNVVAKFGRVVTCNEGIPPIELHDPLIILFCEVTCHIKYFLSPLGLYQ